MRKQDVVLLDFIDSMDAAESLDKLFDVLDKAISELGFDGATYTFIPSLINEALNQFTPVFLKSESYEQKFIEHYTEANFADQDFTIKRITHGDMRCIDWWHEAESKTISAREKHVIEVARHDYMLTSGATLPAYNGSKGAAGISIISSDKSNVFTLRYNDNLATLKKITRLFNDRVLSSTEHQLSFTLPFIRTLSQTERKVLSMLASGMHLKKIADSLNITYKYAGNVVERLREKFGSVSRERLLYIAGLMNFSELI